MSNKSDIPQAPSDLVVGGRGVQCWHDLTAKYAFSPAELHTLARYCRTEDLAELLEREISDTPVVEGSRGQPRAHPAVNQLLSARRLCALLLAQLRLPDLGGQPLPAPSSVQASHAAQARWREQATIRKRRAGGGSGGSAA